MSSNNNPDPSNVSPRVNVDVQNRNDNDIDWDDVENARNRFSPRLANAYLANEWLSDIKFYIPKDNRTIPAHSLIVAAASPVLQCFCFGTGSLKGDLIITVPEYMSAKDFLVVLRYIYVGIVEDNTIDETNMEHVLKIADYFELCELQKHCEDFISTKLSVGNVCQIFYYVHSIDKKVLSDNCLKFMGANMRAILKSGSLMNMEDAALAKLIGTETEHSLAITSEFDFVEPLIEWASAQCVIESLDSSQPKNRRKVIGDRLKLFRFGLMNFDEFMHCDRLFGNGFFTDQELLRTVKQIYNIKNPIAGDESITYPFSGIKRKFDVKNEYVVEWQNQMTHTLRKLYLDVTGMKEPLTLLGFELVCDRTLTSITDANTGLEVPFTQVGKKINLTNGVVAAADHRISLEMYNPLRCYKITQKPAVFFGNPVKNAVFPTFVDGYTMASSITYSHPP